MIKRPMFFNHGTQYFLDHPEKAHYQPSGSPLKSDQITGEDPFAIPETKIPDTDIALYVHYIYQIFNIKIDFFPKSLISYPAEISINENETVFTATSALTIAHPINITAIPELDSEGNIQYRYDFEGYNILATQMNLWGRIGFDVVMERRDLKDLNSAEIPKLRLKIEKLEIDDLAPNSLEEIIEVLATITGQYGYLEKNKLALEKIIFEIMSVSIDTNIVPNPAINEDQAKVWLKGEFLE